MTHDMFDQTMASSEVMHFATLLKSYIELNYLKQDVITKKNVLE